MKKMFMCLVVTLMVVLQAYSAFAACCLPGGGCNDASPAGCVAVFNGTYTLGDCAEPGICGSINGTAAVPTVTEWGMIIFMVLAGLGAVYYLRRQGRVEN